ncbi:MAG: site-2 protease family protein [Gemmatimonadaceae bacterium]|nr:site-2 protease family protein [Gemmatimonadaceae bacterium]
MGRVELFLLIAPALLFSMVAHEYAHGYAALRQGDPTAYQLGRLTWNPVKHIDPFMTILLPILTFFGGGFLFGGAKPVPVVPRNYRNYRKGDIIVSMAGIVTNLILFVVLVGLFAVLGLLGRALPAANDTLAILQVMTVFGIRFNLMLAMFNLLPIPPLDGSHVMKYILPPAWALRYQQLGMYGILILVFFMATGVGRGLLSAWMAPAFAMEVNAMRLVSRFFLTSPFTESLLR